MPRCRSPASGSSLPVAATEVSGDLGGILLAVLTAATWAAYSVAVTPLMQHAPAIRISAVVIPLAWVGIAAVALPQMLREDWAALDWSVWAIVALATLGPLVVTTLLWFRVLDRIGPARATLATNLQPFVAAVFAVVLLSERITWIQAAGGAARRPRHPRGAPPRLGRAGLTRGRVAAAAESGNG